MTGKLTQRRKRIVVAYVMAMAVHVKRLKTNSTKRKEGVRILTVDNIGAGGDH